MTLIYQEPLVALHQGNCLGVLREMPSASVQAIVTSPPYFGLRAYSCEPQIWDLAARSDTLPAEEPPSTTDELAQASKNKCRAGGFHIWGQELIGKSQRQRNGPPGGLHDGRAVNKLAEIVSVEQNLGQWCQTCGAWRGQLGLETSPCCPGILIGHGACGQCYICHLMAIMGELWRVLRDDGTAWIVLSDSFSGGGGYAPDAPSNQHGSKQSTNAGSIKGQPAPVGIPAKNLMLIPQRFTLACQAAGWYVRSVPPWVKSSVLPEPVKDRPSVSHETVILLAKQPTYYWDAEAVRQPNSANSHGGLQPNQHKRWAINMASQKTTLGTEHANGRNRRTGDWWLESLDQVITDTEAWLAHAKQVRAQGGMLLSPEGEPLGFKVNPQPSRVAHYAGFAPALIRPMILASTSEYGCCPEPGCGAPWRRITDQAKGIPASFNGSSFTRGKTHEARAALAAVGTGDRTVSTHTLGWTPTCTCHEHQTVEGYAYCPLPKPDVVPCTVLDPFVGSGTSLVVSRHLGRKGIGIELSESYVDITKTRLHAGLPLFDEPPPSGHPTQEALSFDAWPPSKEPYGRG